MRVSSLGRQSSSAFLFRFTEALVDDTVGRQSSQSVRHTELHLIAFLYVLGGGGVAWSKSYWNMMQSDKRSRKNEEEQAVWLPGCS